MELAAPGAVTVAERLAASVPVAGQHLDAGGRGEHRLAVHHLRPGLIAERRQQGVAAGRAGGAQRHGPDFHALGVITHFAAQGVGEKLVPEADAQQRRCLGQLQGGFQPVHQVSHPAGFVRDHVMGTGDHHAAEARRARQGLAVTGVHHGHRCLVTETLPDPVGEIAVMPLQGGVGATGLQNQ